MSAKRLVLITLSIFAVAAVGMILSREARSAPIGTSGPGNVVVICSSCAFQGMPRDGHVVLMGSRTGEIWAYSDAAFAGNTAPIYVGTLSAVGKSVTKPQ